MYYNKFYTNLKNHPVHFCVHYHWNQFFIILMMISVMLVLCSFTVSFLDETNPLLCLYPSKNVPLVNMFTASTCLPFHTNFLVTPQTASIMAFTIKILPRSSHSVFCWYPKWCFHCCHHEIHHSNLPAESWPGLHSIEYPNLHSQRVLFVPWQLLSLLAFYT